LAFDYCIRIATDARKDGPDLSCLVSACHGPELIREQTMEPAIIRGENHYPQDS
jgi:hypothetical protein